MIISVGGGVFFLGSKIHERERRCGCNSDVGLLLLSGSRYPVMMGLEIAGNQHQKGGRLVLQQPRQGLRNVAAVETKWEGATLGL